MKYWLNEHTPAQGTTQHPCTHRCACVPLRTTRRTTDRKGERGRCVKFWGPCQVSAAIAGFWQPETWGGGGRVVCSCERVVEQQQVERVATTNISHSTYNFTSAVTSASPLSGLFPYFKPSGHFSFQVILGQFSVKQFLYLQFIWV